MESRAALSSAYSVTSPRSPAGRLRLVPPLESSPRLSPEALLAVVEQSAREPFESGALWLELCSGRLRFTELGLTATHCVGVLEPRTGNDVALHALSERRLDILQRVLEGQSLNFIALELNLANSTVSAEFKHAMRALGLATRVAELPILVLQLWGAVRAYTSATPRCARLSVGSSERRVLAMPRVDVCSLECLPRAEAEVCRLLLAGLSHAHIAELRDTSSRTTANQISAIFRKFRVSGRLELLVKIARGGRPQC